MLAVENVLWATSVQCSGTMYQTTKRKAEGSDEKIIRNFPIEEWPESIIVTSCHASQIHDFRLLWKITLEIGSAGKP